MANQEHINLLKQGAAALNSHRSASESMEGKALKLDFSYETFADIDLSDFNLAGANLHGTRFVRVNFGGTDMSSVDFRHSKITDCNFNSCKLISADLSDSVITTTESWRRDCFRKSELQGARFTGAEISNVSFHECVANGLSCVAILQNTDFCNCSFRESSFNFAFFENVSFSFCNLTNSTFAHAKFHGLNSLDGCNLDGTYFQSSIGVWTVRGLENTTGIPADFHTIIRPQSKPFLWFSWELLRKVGRVPVFTPSWIGIVLLIFYLHCIQTINAQVDAAKAMAASTRAQIKNKALENDSRAQAAIRKIADMIANTSVWFPPFAFRWSESAENKSSMAIKTVSARMDILADQIENKLKHISLPADAGKMMISFVLLMMASGLYSAACPEEVNEYSKSHWTYALGHSLACYWGKSWSQVRVRWLTGTLYLLGGTFGIYVLFWKLIWVVWYLSQPVT